MPSAEGDQFLKDEYGLRSAKDGTNHGDGAVGMDYLCKGSVVYFPRAAGNGGCCSDEATTITLRACDYSQRCTGAFCGSAAGFDDHLVTVMGHGNMRVKRKSGVTWPLR
jgi:hypothetical protein